MRRAKTVKVPVAELRCMLRLAIGVPDGPLKEADTYEDPYEVEKARSSAERKYRRFCEGYRIAPEG